MRRPLPANWIFLRIENKNPGAQSKRELRVAAYLQAAQAGSNIFNVGAVFVAQPHQWVRSRQSVRCRLLDRDGSLLARHGQYALTESGALQEVSSVQVSSSAALLVWNRWLLPSVIVVITFLKFFPRWYSAGLAR